LAVTRYDDRRAPVVANGIVFVLAAGEFTGQANDVDGGLYSWQDRVKHSIPAKLYALDAETGKELYSSGKQVTSFLHQSGIAVAGGRVIFGTFDGTIYCFGLRNTSHSEIEENELPIRKAIGLRAACPALAERVTRVFRAIDTQEENQFDQTRNEECLLMRRLLDWSLTLFLAGAFLGPAIARAQARGHCT